MSNKSFEKASHKTRQKIALEKASSKRRRKIALFALGMVIVMGIVAYSLVTRNSNSASAGTSPGNDSSSTTGIAGLAWAQTVSAKFAEQDFVFVILPGTDGATQKIAPIVASAAAKIQAQGVRTDILTLNPSDPEVSITAERLAIPQLPAILALGASGNGVIIANDITETKLLQAYLTASKACAPGASSGCCPTK